MGLSALIRRIVFPNSYSSDAYISYLRNQGVEIGEKCRIWSPNRTDIDVQRPHMLHIGNYVRITANVTILCHDFSRSVFCNMTGYGNVGEARETWIGNNVFIGKGATILMGSHIGDNTIVGAGAIVSGRFPNDVVIAGNPARIIMTIDELFEKRKNEEIAAAKLFAKNYYSRFKVWPNIYQMSDAFSWMYVPHTEETLKDYPALFSTGTIDTESFEESFLQTKPIWPSFDDFLKECKKNDL